MASITYNHSSSNSKGKNWSNVVSVRFKVYQGKGLPPFTKTVKVPEGMTGMRKIQEFAKEEAKTFEEECKGLALGIADTCTANDGTVVKQLVSKRITFAEYAKQALLDNKSAKDIKKSTSIRYDALLARINTEIGDMPIDEIKSADMKRLMRNMSSIDEDPAVEESLKHLRNEKNGELLARKTIREHLQLASYIFSAAVDDNLITINPTSGLEYKQVSPTPECFQVDEVKKILEYMNKESLKWRTITLMLLGTGCRRGELVGLKKSAIDWETGEVHIASTLLVDKNIGVYETTPKSEASVRPIKVSRNLLAVMREYSEEQEARKKALGDKWVESPYFLTQDNGSRMHPDSVTDFYKKFKAKVLKKYHYDLPHINPHKFRHTYASMLIASNTDIATIAKLMGHHDATVTLKIYATALNRSIEKASKKINEEMDTLIESMTTGDHETKCE